MRALWRHLLSLCDELRGSVDYAHKHGICSKSDTSRGLKTSFHNYIRDFRFNLQKHVGSLSTRSNISSLCTATTEIADADTSGRPTTLPLH